MASPPNHAAVDVARAYLSRFLVANAHRRRLAQGSAYGPSAEEVVAALQATDGPPPNLAAEDARVQSAEGALGAVLAATPEPLLARLGRVFSLTRLDLAIICVLLAPELDHELERAYTFAIDDFTRKRVDVGFVARVIGARTETVVDRVLLRFDDSAPMRRHGIVTVTAPAADGPSSMRGVRLADRIVGFLRGHDTVDELVHGLVRIGTPAVPLAEIIMNPELVAQIKRAIDPRSGAPRLLLAGPEGTGRALLVEALFADAGRRTMRIDLAGIVAEGRIEERIAAALREAALRDAAAILDGSSLEKEVPRALVLAISDGIADLAVPIVFTLPNHPTWLVAAVPSLLELDVPAPTFRQRLELWRRALPPSLTGAEDVEIVASRYAFTGATIARAASRAASSARLRDPEAPKVSLDDLGDAARLMFSHRLGGMAQRIPAGFSWDDLVLPKDTLDALKEVTRFARYRPFLLEEWGFAAKLPYGKGVSAILAGPPGTGKTMVAQLLAKELGYDLYRIDLSQVVNKYIGETEKNLARIFDEAENAHAVLFFDEADSLFAKRTEVKSSNDRYANLEVNYLLQRMETYDGVTLLATNLEQGLDDAFKRRVRFSVQFELPEEPERKLLWRSMFPPKVPLASDIDWDMIAKRFEMAGGYIKKAALRAALIAAESRRPITTADLFEAARHEYREMGRII
ncbi:MAG: ATP-binding protein [Deltaproteobacteria bacterium]|nr:ATP-binding protein [Deltaproteobacteria bacterium]